MNNARQEKLVGVVVSLPTFTTDDCEIDFERQRRHIRWLVEHGIREGSGVVMAAGGLGEGYFLAEEEWRKMCDVLAEEARGEVPTMLGVFDLSARLAASKAKYAADAGIDFLQINPPHFMVPSDDDVFGHYRCINDAADIGIMCYNTPWAMPQPAYELGPRILERLAELENVLGVKWTSFSTEHFYRNLYLFSDRFNFIDNDMRFSIVFRMGMKGFVDFHANVLPRLSLHFWNLLRQKRYEEYDALHMKVNFEPFAKVVAPEEAAWVGVGEGPTAKGTMKMLGLECGPPFPAQAPVSPEYLQAVRRAVEASGMLDWAEGKG